METPLLHVLNQLTSRSLQILPVPTPALPAIKHVTWTTLSRLIRLIAGKGLMCDTGVITDQVCHV